MSKENFQIPEKSEKSKEINNPSLLEKVGKFSAALLNALTTKNKKNPSEIVKALKIQRQEIIAKLPKPINTTKPNTNPNTKLNKEAA